MADLQDEIPGSPPTYPEPSLCRKCRSTKPPELRHALHGSARGDVVCWMECPGCGATGPACERCTSYDAHYDAIAEWNKMNAPRLDLGLRWEKFKRMIAFYLVKRGWLDK